MTTLPTPRQLLSLLRIPTSRVRLSPEMNLSQFFRRLLLRTPHLRLSRSCLGRFILRCKTCAQYSLREVSVGLPHVTLAPEFQRPQCAVPRSMRHCSNTFSELLFISSSLSLQLHLQGVIRAEPLPHKSPHQHSPQAHLCYVPH
jgi:hypothetical protein